MKVSVRADTVHGKLHIGASQRCALQDGILTWPDGPVTLTIEREQATRSARANAYYWGAVIQALVNHTGYTPDEMHTVMKARFLPKDVALARDNGTIVAEYVIGGSTVELGTVEFFDYVEAIRQWAFEALDVSIPPPDPEWRERERGGGAGPPPPPV